MADKKDRTPQGMDEVLKQEKTKKKKVDLSKEKAELEYIEGQYISQIRAIPENQKMEKNMEDVVSAMNSSDFAKKNKLEVSIDKENYPYKLVMKYKKGGQEMIETWYMPVMSMRHTMEYVDSVSEIPGPLGFSEAMATQLLEGKTKDLSDRIISMIDGQIQKSAQKVRMDVKGGEKKSSGWTLLGGRKDNNDTKPKTLEEMEGQQGKSFSGSAKVGGLTVTGQGSVSEKSMNSKVSLETEIKDNPMAGAKLDLGFIYQLDKSHKSPNDVVMKGGLTMLWAGAKLGSYIEVQKGSKMELYLASLGYKLPGGKIQLTAGVYRSIVNLYYACVDRKIDVSPWETRLALEWVQGFKNEAREKARKEGRAYQDVEWKVSDFVREIGASIMIFDTKSQKFGKIGQMIDVTGDLYTQYSVFGGLKGGTNATIDGKVALDVGSIFGVYEKVRLDLRGGIEHLREDDLYTRGKTTTSVTAGGKLSVQANDWIKAYASGDFSKIAKKYAVGVELTGDVNKDIRLGNTYLNLGHSSLTVEGSLTQREGGKGIGKDVYRVGAWLSLDFGFWGEPQAYKKNRIDSNKISELQNQIPMIKEKYPNLFNDFDKVKDERLVQLEKNPEFARKLIDKGVSTIMFSTLAALSDKIVDLSKKSSIQNEKELVDFVSKFGALVNVIWGEGVKTLFPDYGSDKFTSYSQMQPDSRMVSEVYMSPIKKDELRIKDLQIDSKVGKPLLSADGRNIEGLEIDLGASNLTSVYRTNPAFSGGSFEIKNNKLILRNLTSFIIGTHRLAIATTEAGMYSVVEIKVDAGSKVFVTPSIIENEVVGEDADAFVDGRITKQGIQEIKQNQMPDQLNLGTKTKAERDTGYWSNVVVVNGIKYPVSIYAKSGAKFKINGGAEITSGKVKLGDTVQVRVQSSSKYEDTVTAEIVMGDNKKVSSFFEVTTKAEVKTETSGGGGGGGGGSPETQQAPTLSVPGDFTTSTGATTNGLTFTVNDANAGNTISGSITLLGGGSVNITSTSSGSGSGSSFSNLTPGSTVTFDYTAPGSTGLKRIRYNATDNTGLPAAQGTTNVTVN